MTDSNDLVINEFRAHGGRVDIGGFGTNLVLIHSLGARSGVERVHPVAPLRDGHDWLIVASTGGSPTNPAWYYNLLRGSPGRPMGMVTRSSGISGQRCANQTSTVSSGSMWLASSSPLKLRRRS